MNVLDNLTPSGWVVCALAVLFDLKLALEFIAWCVAALGKHKPKPMSLDILLPTVFTVWLAYLLS